MTNFIVAVYEVNQAFGGHEEGGWWYNSGELIRILKTFKSETRAYAYSRALNKRLRSRDFGPNIGRHAYTSVLSEGEVRAYVYENQAEKYFPTERPHYE